MELHHPIISKLWGIGDQTYRHYGTTRFQPHHMNDVLVESWDSFKVSSGNIIVDSFAKTHLLTLSPTNIITNTYK